MTCKYCDRKVPLAWLDEHGVRPSVSGLPATSLSHHVDDYWWPCERGPLEFAASHAHLARALRGAIRELEAGGYSHDHVVLAPWKRLVAQAPAPADTVTGCHDCGGAPTSLYRGVDLCDACVARRADTVTVKREDVTWHPAATAPQDGSPFHACGPSLVDPDFNPWGQVEAVFDGERFIGAIWCGTHDIWRTEFIKFTHWRPFDQSLSAARRLAGLED